LVGFSNYLQLGNLIFAGTASVDLKVVLIFQVLCMHVLSYMNVHGSRTSLLDRIVVFSKDFCSNSVVGNESSISSEDCKVPQVQCFVLPTRVVHSPLV